MKPFRIILIFFVPSFVFGQTDSSNIYFQALEYFNEYLNTDKDYIGKEKFNDTELYIEYSRGITDYLPHEIGKRKVIILTRKNVRDVYKKNNDKVKQIVIFPAYINKDLIEVNFTPYHGSHKGKILALSDWIVIQFKYDYESGQIKYYTTITGGI